MPADMRNRLLERQLARRQLEAALSPPIVGEDPAARAWAAAAPPDLPDGVLHKHRFMNHEATWRNQGAPQTPGITNCPVGFLE